MGKQRERSSRWAPQFQDHPRSTGDARAARCADAVVGVGGGQGHDSSAVIDAITSRLLAAFAQGPAGRPHPAQDNLARLGIGASAAQAPGPAGGTGD